MFGRKFLRRKPHSAIASRFERLEDRAMLAAFTPGNLVIYRVGTGSAALSSAATEVFLDEYGTNGWLVQSIAMPTTDSGSNQTLTAAGNPTTEGLITRSTDGSFIIATGYDAAVGTASVNSSSSLTVNRVIGRIAADGTIDTSTTTTAFSGTSIRSAASDNGAQFWATGGNTGTVYQTLGAAGAGTTVSTTVTNQRSVGIFNGQLYASNASGSNTRVISVGTGLPTTATTASQLSGLPTTGNANQFFFADLDGSPGVDTVYLALDAGTIQKYSLVSGTWTANGTIAAAAVRGLTGSVSGSTVTLYATAPTNFWTVTDSSGYNATVTATVTSLKVPSANTEFRGIAFAPDGGPSTVLPTLAVPAISAVTTTSASLSCEVTDAGGGQVFTRGFVYSVSSVNANPVIGGPGVTQQSAGSGVGVFVVNLSSLPPGTQYSVRAFASNSAGTQYSDPVALKILDAWVFDDVAGTTTTDSLVRTGTWQIIKRGLGTLILDKVNSYSGGTVVEGGELIVRNIASLGTGMLEVRAGAKVIIDVGSVNWGDGRNFVQLQHLRLDPAGRLEVGTSQIRIAGGGYDTVALRAALVAGRAGGDWQGGTAGVGITSRFAADGLLRGVGYGVMSSTNELRLGFAAFGDSNLDGRVNSTDVSLINSGGRFGQVSSVTTGWRDGDYNYDGRVNSTDISMLNNTGLFGSGSYLPVAPSSQSMTTAESGAISADLWAAYALTTESKPLATTRR